MRKERKGKITNNFTQNTTEGKGDTNIIATGEGNEEWEVRTDNITRYCTVFTICTMMVIHYIYITN